MSRFFTSIFYVLFILLIVILCAISVRYKFDQDVSEIESIQIVNLDCSMGYHSGSPYSEENVSVISTIEVEKYDEFLSDFHKVKSYQPNIGSRILSVSGRAIRVIYTNGIIELITCSGTAIVKDGTIRVQTTMFDKENFFPLLDKYS